jgi:hypothetical protein
VAIARKLSYYLKHNSPVVVVFLVGLLLVAVGGYFWNDHPRLSATLIGVGASLIAASVVAYLSPSTQEVYERFLDLGISDVYLSRSDVENSQWCRWLREARNQCTLFGIANNRWCRDPDFKPAVLELVRRSVTVKIFFLNPTSQEARVRADEEKPATARDTVQTIKESISFTWQLKQQIQEDQRDNLKLYVYDATPSFGATWIDTFMIATHYLAGFPNVTSPALKIKPVQAGTVTRDLYGIYEENMRNVEKQHATEIKDDNVSSFTDKGQSGA